MSSQSNTDKAYGQKNFVQPVIFKTKKQKSNFITGHFFKTVDTNAGIEKYVNGFNASILIDGLSDEEHTSSSTNEEKKLFVSDIWFIINPNNSKKLLWDFIGLLFVLFYTLVVPIRIAFSFTVLKGKTGYEFVAGEKGWLVMDLACDIYFLIDIVLTFRTALPNRLGELNTNWRHLAKAYCLSWFLVDIIASFPLTLLQVFYPKSFQGGGQINKLLRSIRIFKLFRMFRIPRLYKALERRKIISPGIIRLCRLFIVYITLIHWLACGYWLVSQTEGFCAFQPEKSASKSCFPKFGTTPCKVDELTLNDSIGYYKWDNGIRLPSSIDPSQYQSIQTEKNGFYECVDAWTPWVQALTQDLQTQYLQAFFWAMQVTTGIGHDIMPRSNPEVTYTIFSTFIGVFLYAFIIGSIPGVLTEMEGESIERRRELDFINDFLKKQHVPSIVRRDINNYMDFVDTVNKDGGARLLDKVMDVLPDDTALRLKLSIYWRYVKSMELFQNIAPEAAIKIVENLKSRIVIPGEVVLKQGKYGGCMFLVRSGNILLTHHMTSIENWTRLVKDILLKNSSNNSTNFLFNMSNMQQEKMRKPASKRIISKGDFAGEDMYLSRPHHYSAIALGYCDVLTLEKHQFDNVCKMYPSVSLYINRFIQKRKSFFSRNNKCIKENINNVDTAIHVKDSYELNSYSMSSKLGGEDGLENKYAVRSSRIEMDLTKIEETKKMDKQNGWENKYAIPPSRIEMDLTKIEETKNMDEQKECFRNTCNYTKKAQVIPNTPPTISKKAFLPTLDPIGVNNKDELFNKVLLSNARLEKLLVHSIKIVSKLQKRSRKK